mmetsp:Transcript_8188/g.34398  ORF Transcript_8188/g.34398 Transcript_8188/m.34398 type:complete len:1216 (+) Transcript_8188:36-3683(+)
MAEEAGGARTPKLLSVLKEDESPSTQYRKRNSLMKDMRNDLFSEFNLLEEEEETKRKAEKAAEEPASSAAEAEEEEDDEEDDYDESDGDDDDDENCFWSDEEKEGTDAAARPSGRRRTVSKVPRPSRAPADEGKAEEEAPAQAPEETEAENVETDATHVAAVAKPDTPAAEGEEAYKETDLFRQLEELKLRRAASTLSAERDAAAEEENGPPAVVDPAPEDSSTAAKKETVPEEAKEPKEIEQSSDEPEKTQAEKAQAGEDSVQAHEPTAGGGACARKVSLVDDDALAAVARMPSTFAVRPEALSTSLDREMRGSLAEPSPSRSSIERELEEEIEKEVQKIVASEVAVETKQKDAALPAEVKESPAPEVEKESPAPAKAEVPRFTAKEPSRVSSGSGVKFSKSKHSRAGSDVKPVGKKRGHRRSRSTGKVHMQVVADAARLEHSDDSKKSVDDDALVVRRKHKSKKASSDRRSTEQALAATGEQSSSEVSKKTKTKKPRHAEEKGSKERTKEDERHKPRKEKSTDAKPKTDGEKVKHKSKERLSVDTKAERKNKRSSRTIDAARRTLAHKKQMLLGKKEAAAEAQQEAPSHTVEEEAALQAEALAAIEAARQAVHQELTAAPATDPAGKARAQSADAAVDPEDGTAAASGPHFLGPRDRSVTQELAIEGAPVVPGADYFLTEADRALIKEMEEKEARRAAVHQSSESDDGKGKKNMSASQTRTMLRSFLKNLHTEGDEQAEDVRAQLLQKQFSHQQELDARKAAIALPEDEDLPFKERMRNKTINEVMLSEVDYVDDLHFIIGHFHDPMLERGLVTEQQRVAIFSNIDLIFDMHTNLLDKLGKWAQHPDGPQVADCFGELTQYRKLFSDYCNNHANAANSVDSLMRKSAAFRQFVEEEQSHPRCNGMPFTSFLIKPVQRICKYPLFLRELVKHTDEVNEEYPKLVAVLESVNSVVESINNTKREADNMAAITRIQRKLGVKTVELLQPGRVFVREGFLQETVKGEPTLLLYCLFNDILLRVEKKVKKFGTIRKQEKFTLADQLPIYSVTVQKFGNNGIAIECGKKSYRVTAADGSERDSWVEAIQAQQKTMFESGSGPADGSEPVRSPSRISSLPTTPTSPLAPADAAPADARKVKCYLHKGTSNQRIRKVVLSNVGSIDALLANIRKEFEWADDRKLTVGYLDEDDDLVEISSSISLEEVCSEAKLLEIIDNAE